MAGRVGDSPVVGSGCYVNKDIGGAAATGDGDIMMRFLPSFAAVTYMMQGYNASAACSLALDPIVKYYPSFSGGMVCLTKDGEHSAATRNMEFSYSVASDVTDGQVVVYPVS